MHELLILEADRTINVHIHGEAPFVHACMCGRLDAVRMLLALEGDRRISVHASGEASLY